MAVGSKLLIMITNLLYTADPNGHFNLWWYEESYLIDVLTQGVYSTICGTDERRTLLVAMPTAM